MGKCQDLLEAARCGNTSVVSKILQPKGGPLSSFRRSPSINWQDVNGYTPLHHACLNGHYETVKVLLTHHAAHDIQDIRGSTPLYLAAWAGNEHIINLILMLRGNASLNDQNVENETALHCASQHGYNSVVSALLARGADPTIRNNSFQTPLDLAAQFGRLDVIQTLINKHPELIAPYRMYDDAVEIACPPRYKKTPTNHIFTQSALHLAARNGHNEVVKALLAAGVNVNTLTNAGSALHEAALCGKKNVVCTLLSAGVDLYAVDGNSRTALDILKDYPTNVTFEILTIINDFRKTTSSVKTKNYFRPIKDENANHRTSPSNSVTNSTDIPCYEQQHQTSLTINSLDRCNNTRERYTPMEPIKWTKSSNDLRVKHEQLPEYKSVYKSNLLHRRLGGMDRQFPKFSTVKEIQNQTPLKSTLYQCVDEYVEMTMPNSSPCSSPQPPSTPVVIKQSFHNPKKCMEHGDYANINIINAHNKHECHDTISLRSCSFDSNNNNQKNKNGHSPTPDCPPPSASEAESTIFEFVKPSERSLKRKSLLLQQEDNQFYNGLKSFIWEDQLDPQDERLDSLSSSRVSECVEEYVGDEPFAGLFKGSSLNLANASTSDLRSSSVVEEVPSGLRSPNLVRSVKSVTNKHSAKIESQTLESNYEFDAQKAWEEINTIFENIGSEVAAKEAKLEDLKEENALTSTLRKKSLNIRKPAELLLGPMTEDQTSNSNWCHSANTLIYGYVIYNAFYLGSTVIRELHGIASTRKSIQKLKREETPSALQEDNEDNGLIKDINSSTRILKETNEQTRLEVGIALSHAGVRFIDVDNKNTICVHDIENINCVSQDAEDLRYFAYITRENDIHYCHVFMVDDLSLATEIILTLGQAFEVAYQLSKISQEDSRPTSQSSQEKRLSCSDIVGSV